MIPQTTKRPAPIRASQTLNHLKGNARHHLRDNSKTLPLNQVLRQLWQQSVIADPEHAFCDAFKVKPYGLRQLGCDLLVPIQNGKHSVNLVRVNPEHELTPVAPFAEGTFFMIGKPAAGKLLYISSTLQDCLHLYDVTGFPCAASVWPKYLPSVTEKLMAQFPDADIVVIAERDGPGYNFAELAALKTGCQIIIPPRTIPVWVNSYVTLHLWSNELAGRNEHA